MIKFYSDIQKLNNDHSILLHNNKQNLYLPYFKMLCEIKYLYSLIQWQFIEGHL